MSSAEEHVVVVEPTKARNFITRNWRGEYSLGVTYWVFGIVLTDIALFANVILVGVVAITLGATEHQAKLATLPTSATIMLWSTVGIFRSADNHIKRTGRRGWATAARVMTVLGLLYALGAVGKVLQQ